MPKYDGLQQRLNLRGIEITSKQLEWLDQQNAVISVFNDLLMSIGKTTVMTDGLGNQITRAEWDKIQIANRIVMDTALTVFCRWLEDHPLPK